MLSLLRSCGPRAKDEKQRWKKIEDDAEQLHKLPSWDAPDNTLLMQAFEWHVPDDQHHWSRLRRALPGLKSIGVDRMWIPPGCKAMNPSGNGYDIYDLYDLGEFDQKGARATKWGTKKDLQELVSCLRELDIDVYWDAVLNHKAGADYTERFPAVKVDPERRDMDIMLPQDIEGWVGYDFPGRGNLHSPMKYHWHHFSGIDWDQSREEQTIYRIDGPGKRWADDVSKENGNYDFLMFADLDYSNQEVREDVLRWSEWIGEQLPGISGMRLDAAKHYSAGFQRELIDRVRARFGQDYFFIGEYWSSELKTLIEYLEVMDYRLSLFDVPLVEAFSKKSQVKAADLRTVFGDTLVASKPEYAITFVTNHDTTPVLSIFKPLAYALILLRDKGQPCVFYGDLYGIGRGVKQPMIPSCGGKLPILCRARKLYAYGYQQDYFDRPNCIGFVRYGNLRHPSGLACIISNAAASQKRMYVGRQHVKERWTDVLGWHKKTVIIDKKGYGVFPVSAMSVSVWVDSAAKGRDTLQDPFDTNIHGH
ncbi:alpha-amylase [Aspergillus taichungensis]|uniref:Alpha-amylase n=1 Tax=Aspergillus taichungensis TaxID=482145 RepID=A0A2J5I188_9EURO|nr:alpha-amylase [Aspergillus taichungensis]